VTHLVEDLGAYVLGALPEEEEARVREHLVRCATCREEHGRLTGLVPLLDLAEPGAEGATAKPSPLLEEAVLAGFAAEHGGGDGRPRRRFGRGRAPGDQPRGGNRILRGLRLALPSAAAGAALAVVVLALAGAFASDDPAGMTVDLRGAAGSARATLEAAEAGTVIELDARLPPSGRREHYDLFMLSGDYEISAGTFRVGSDGHVEVELACGGAPDAYDSIEIRRDGERVLRSDLPA
jgi:anti-sigma factor RsiW